MATSKLPEDKRIINLKNEAKKYGCPALLNLRSTPTAEHLNYLDLCQAGRGNSLLPDAVAEFQGQPVLYLLDGDNEDASTQQSLPKLRELQQRLANRGDHAYLGVVSPGQLTLYPINLDRDKLEQSDFQIIKTADEDAPIFFQSLASGTRHLPGQPEAADYVFDEIHDLLSMASKELTGPLQPLEVLSVTGRALFFRFLHDRGIVRQSELADICPSASDLRDVFSNAEKAAATSCWLDETFNGDLLPLVPGIKTEVDSQIRLQAYQQFYRSAGEATAQNVFLHLEAILRGWKMLPGSNVQLTIDWGDFNFAHIPVGVLSQVYETFSRQWDEAHSGETGIYYTPKNIAELVVEEALSSLDDPAEAHVLDPACGAGVFLVLAFRHLVRKRWEKDEKRPDTRTIQRILYNQIRGFDVSESALRLAALALYVTAIEVNGTTRPPKSLKFPEPLKDAVLFNFGQRHTEEKRGFQLGSLSSAVPVSFNGTFDVVVGNPPWTRLGTSAESKEEKAKEKAHNDAMNREFTTITQRVLKERRISDLARSYTNPDNNPDLPFLWRSMEWAKPDGVIAMALPARIILKQRGTGKAARDAIMRGIKVTGIINGSDLEETKVWPNMKLPFLLLFAHNSVPPSDHHFHFATPVRERQLADQGQFRLDYQSAEPIPATQVIEKPWLLKALSVGTVLDVELWESLGSQPNKKPLKQIWKGDLFSGKGFSLNPRRQDNASKFLRELPVFESLQSDLLPSFDKLPTFEEKYGAKAPYQTCGEELYKCPLLIIPKSPGEETEGPRAFRSINRNLCFSQSYYGFSAANHNEAEIMVSLLYLITHSQLFQHFCLIRSSSIGASWRIFLKEDLEAFPFPAPEKLSSAQKHRIITLAHTLETAAHKPWDALNKFIFQLYGMDNHDMQVVKDTVGYGAPYRSVRLRAENPPDPNDAELFRNYLEEMLQPFFEVADQKIEVSVLPSQSITPWKFLTISLAGDKFATPSKLLARVMNEANKTAASRVTMRIPGGGLLIGLLNQCRFWTRSRARLCGLHLIREHLDAL